MTNLGGLTLGVSNTSPTQMCDDPTQIFLWYKFRSLYMENSVLKSACETTSSTTMDVEVDDGVDVSVPQLRDYLSDRPASSPLVNVGEGPNVMKKAVGSSAPRVFEVGDMTF